MFDIVEAGLKNYKRVAVMGGTFDPIHYGHLVTAEAVRHEFQIELVVFIPTGVPPHKGADNVLDAEQRFLMTVLATTENPHFAVSRMEIDRKGETYTVDTIKQLRAMLDKDAQIFFITGADAVQQILTWRDSEQLLKMCAFVAVTRPGYNNSELLGEVERLKEKFMSKLHFLEVPALAISSTDIRRRVHDGKPITYLVPDIVERHILKNGLYRGGAPQNQDIAGEIRGKIQKLLSEQRFRHTVGVAEEAAKLAEIYGLPPEKAYLAGILHDCAKELSPQKKRRLCKEFGIHLDEITDKQIDLAHGAIGAELARLEYGIADADILDAIRSHTTGRPDMSLLEKIMFVADLSEPNREDYTGLNEIRSLAYQDLDLAVVTGLRRKLEFTGSKKAGAKKEIHPLSVHALRFYMKETKKNGSKERR